MGDEELREEGAAERGEEGEAEPGEGGEAEPGEEAEEEPGEGGEAPGEEAPGEGLGPGGGETIVMRLARLRAEKDKCKQQSRLASKELQAALKKRRKLLSAAKQLSAEDLALITAQQLAQQQKGKGKGEDGAGKGKGKGNKGKGLGKEGDGKGKGAGKPAAKGAKGLDHGKV